MSLIPYKFRLDLSGEKFITKPQIQSQFCTMDYVKKENVYPRIVGFLLIKTGHVPLAIVLGNYF